MCSRRVETPWRTTPQSPLYIDALAAASLCRQHYRNTDTTRDGTAETCRGERVQCSYYKNFCCPRQRGVVVGNRGASTSTPPGAQDDLPSLTGPTKPSAPSATGRNVTCSLSPPSLPHPPALNRPLQGHTSSLHILTREQGVIPRTAHTQRVCCRRCRSPPLPDTRKAPLSRCVTGPVPALGGWACLLLS